MKRFYLLRMLVLLLVVSLSQALLAQEEEEVLCLRVVETSGTTVRFAIDEKPTMTFNGSTMVVDGRVSIEVALDEVEEYNFGYDVPTATGIAQVESDGQTEFSNGKAYISGLKEDSTVYVYTVDGQQVLAVRASAEGSAAVDLSALKHGVVYILRTPGASYKVMNK